MDPWAPYLGVSVMQLPPRVGPWLRRRCAAPAGLALALLAAAPAALALSFAERQQPGDELGLPSGEVGLNAAVFAFHHVAVALPSRHHATSTEHPEPLVHVLPHLREKGTGEREQPSDQKMPVCAATAGASAGGRSPVAAGKKESLRQKGFRVQM